MFSIKVTDSSELSYDFSCQDKQSLLDAALARGVYIPWACKGGGCGLCKIKVEDGNYELGKSSKAVLPDHERDRNYALACKTYPTSNLSILININKVKTTI